jgi:Tol biopolymer transport system component
MRSFALTALIICCVVFGMAVAAYAQPASQHHGRIAWSRYTDQSFTAARIVTGNPDGSGVSVLKRSSKGTYDLDPIWSPDASRIVFERDSRDGHATS